MHVRALLGRLSTKVTLPNAFAMIHAPSIALVSFDVSGTSVTHFPPVANGFGTSFGFDLFVEEYFLTAGNGP
jgi:hypothetical protein